MKLMIHQQFTDILVENPSNYNFYNAGKSEFIAHVDPIFMAM